MFLIFLLPGFESLRSLFFVEFLLLEVHKPSELLLSKKILIQSLSIFLIQTYSCVHFGVKISFLHLEPPAVVLYLGVGAVLDVHGGLLALCLSDPCISVGLQILLFT